MSQELTDLAKYLYRKFGKNLDGLEGFGVGIEEESTTNVLMVYVRHMDCIKPIHETLKDFSVKKVYRIVGESILTKNDSTDEMLDKLKKYLNFAE